MGEDINMADDHTFVAMLKDSDPERFLFVTLDSGYSRITKTSYDKSKQDMWADLHKMGIPDEEISSLIENARKKPV